MSPLFNTNIQLIIRFCKLEINKLREYTIKKVTDCSATD